MIIDPEFYTAMLNWEKEMLDLKPRVKPTAQPEHYVAVMVGGHRNYKGPWRTWWRIRMFYDLTNATEYRASLRAPRKSGRIIPDRLIRTSWDFNPDRSWDTSHEQPSPWSE